MCLNGLVQEHLAAFTRHYSIPYFFYCGKHKVSESTKKLWSIFIRVCEFVITKHTHCKSFKNIIHLNYLFIMKQVFTEHQCQLIHSNIHHWRPLDAIHMLYAEQMNKTQFLLIHNLIEKQTCVQQKIMSNRFSSLWSKGYGTTKREWLIP